MMNTDQKTLLQFKADCSSCSGLCCVAFFFSKIDGFPDDKEAGKPCGNLLTDYRCKIHPQLEKQNMKGCLGYDCFGAGQHVTQALYHGQTYQDLPKRALEIFDVFIIVAHLFQMRYFLVEALTLNISEKMKKEIRSLIIENEIICNYYPNELLSFDLKKYKNKINISLEQIIQLLKKDRHYQNKRCPTDFLAKNFKGKDMRRLDLSMKLLIAANFDGCVFEGTFFLGADTRDANFSNANLKEAIFLTQGQINLAKGNRHTKLPKHLDYPRTWK